MTRIVHGALWLLAGGWLAVIAVAILPDPINLPLFLLLAAVFTSPGWPLARYMAGPGAGALTHVVLALPDLVGNIRTEVPVQ